MGGGGGGGGVGHLTSLTRLRPTLRHTTTHIPNHPPPHTQPPPPHHISTPPPHLYTITTTTTTSSSNHHPQHTTTRPRTTPPPIHHPLLQRTAHIIPPTEYSLIHATAIAATTQATQPVRTPSTLRALFEVRPLTTLSSIGPGAQASCGGCRTESFNNLRRRWVPPGAPCGCEVLFFPLSLSLSLSLRPCLAHTHTHTHTHTRTHAHHQHPHTETP